MSCEIAANLQPSYIRHVLLRSCLLVFNKLVKKFRAIYLVFVFIAFGACAFIEPYWLEDITYRVASRDVPKKFDNAKIIFISDIHHGPYFNLSRVRSLVRRVNLQNPDIILLGGDYVHRDPKYIIPCFNELKELKAPLGVFGVLGNHDHWEGTELTEARMAKAGIVQTDNKSFWVAEAGEKIKIGGVGDFYEDSQNLNPTIEDVGKDDFVVLLSHNPDYVEAMRSDKVDLVLSGHTHAGQATLFGLWAPMVPSKYGPKYRSGMISRGDLKLIVSNGIGTITPPVRLFARPQIVTVILKRK